MVEEVWQCAAGVLLPTVPYSVALCRRASMTHCPLHHVPQEFRCPLPPAVGSRKPAQRAME